MPIEHSILNRTHQKIIVFGIILAFFSSCTIIKKYQANKPFVYKTNINVIGNFTNVEKETLVSRLKGQLDDSMRARSVSKVAWSVMKNPPLYDSINADKSVLYMRALLTSLGYFKDTITYNAKIDSAKGDQYRTTVNFDVKPGKVVRLDSFSYNFRITDLQNIAVANQKESFLKKGEPFAKANISLELDRLVELFRNNGYMRFGREDLYGLWDTMDVSLLRPVIDPFEQLEILQKIKERRENPRANLEIKLKPNVDSSKLTRYFIGNVTIYPDYVLDTTLFTSSRKETIVNGVKIISYQNFFIPGILPQNIFLHRGDVYDQRNYFRTINRINSLGAWSLVNIDQTPRKNTDTADFIVRMTPARKYSFTANLEGSRNQTAVSGNLFGIAVNIGLQNRNFAKRANLANTNIRFGVETGRDTATDIKFIQTRQVSFSHTIYFPRPIPATRWMSEKMRNSFRTILAFNTALTERRLLYNLNTINGSWGYEFQWGKKLITLRVPNIEYSSFFSKPKLDTIFKYNPSLRNVFTDGFISSFIGGLTLTGGKNKNINVFRTNAEVSGFLSGLIKNNKFLDSNLYRFIKVDAEFIRKIVYTKSVVALRLFAGMGYELNSTVDPTKKDNLPFFRQYFAGGPNSMRAWGLRRLGPGSLKEDFGLTGIPDRYGDIQLEGNIEYRIRFFTLFGIPVNGAIFTDVGNIWYMKKATGRAPESIFNVNRLWNDIAIGTGIGFRFDFSFFVVRFDISHKVKDPSPAPVRAYLQNKWFGYVQKDFSRGTQFQLGISYPFIL